MAEALKLMYSQEKLLTLSNSFAKHYQPFDKKAFMRHFKTLEWNDAELKGRVRLVARAMHAHLPADYRKAIEILVPVSKNFGGFFSVCFPDYVELFGMDDWNTSMYALGEFTQTSTAEFAIRPFFMKDQKRVMTQMLQWSRDKNVHLRRLSSEGCRPRLPWGLRLGAFVKDPSPIFPVLENLKDDAELYVRKSVANNLNDISKDHPEIVIALAKKWMGKSANTDWIVKHALRGLLKSGNKDALKLFGHHDAKGIEIEGLAVTKKKLAIGAVQGFSFDVKNTTKKSLEGRIEFAIDYMKSNGSASRKVFQVSKLALPPGSVNFRRTQRFQDFTTRKHYPGKHTLSILVNGEEKASVAFLLTH